jgi:small subunit ribosomal protein S12
MPTLNQLLFKYKSRIKKKHTCNVKALNKCPQKKAIIIKIRIVKPKKPNSAQRKIVKLKILKKKFIIAYIPGQGHTLKTFFSVMVAGGRANDLPGVRFTLIRGKYDFSSKESFTRKNRLSKFGISPKFLSVMYFEEAEIINALEKEKKKKQEKELE